MLLDMHKSSAPLANNLLQQAAVTVSHQFWSLAKTKSSAAVVDSWCTYIAYAFIGALPSHNIYNVPAYANYCRLGYVYTSCTTHVTASASPIAV